MTERLTVGKREFIQHTSAYLKLAEKEGAVIITHRNQPALIIQIIAKQSINDLRGLIKNIEVIGDINDPALPGFDQW